MVTVRPGPPGRRGRSVSVIIPTLNEGEWLPGLLADLEMQTRPADEVLVVDGGSADDTVAVATAAGVRVLHAERGAAPQRNAGAAAATGDLLVFVDADARLAPDVLERVLAGVVRRGLDAACPIFLPWPGDPLLRLFFAWLDGVFVLTAPFLACGGGGFLAVRAALFARLGGFDGRYRFEDAHLIRRAGRLGRYRVLPVRVHVSDRRFRRDGTLRTMGRYVALGVLLAFGQLRAANLIGYGSGSQGGTGAGAPGTVVRGRR
jgi:glycosyltransferase involved in cell wall biosynthesis